MNQIRYEWELRGLLNEWLSIEREITLDGILLEPLTKDGIEYIRFTVPLSTTDKSQSRAMKKCMNKLEGLIKTWSFYSATPVRISEKELILTNEQALEKMHIVREKTVSMSMNVILKKNRKKR